MSTSRDLSITLNFEQTHHVQAFSERVSQLCAGLNAVHQLLSVAAAADEGNVHLELAADALAPMARSAQFLREEADDLRDTFHLTGTGVPASEPAQPEA